MIEGNKYCCVSSVGFPEEKHNTWEPLDNLPKLTYDSKKLMEEYEREQKNPRCVRSLYPFVNATLYLQELSIATYAYLRYQYIGISHCT